MRAAAAGSQSTPHAATLRHTRPRALVAARAAARTPAGVNVTGRAPA